MRRPTRAAALLALTIAGLAGPDTAVAEKVVDARALQARVQADPFLLEFTDRRGRTVLAQDPRTGAEITGTVGFRAGGTWTHATRVIEARRQGRAWIARLATTDAGRELELRLAPAGGGVIALEATPVGGAGGAEAWGMGFEAPPGQRYLGFGERSNAVDQRGNVVENYVAEGPFQAEERPFLEAFLPPWGYRERDDATYFPMPWLLSTDGYGVLVDNVETSYFRLGTEDPDAWSVEVVDAPADELGDESSAPPAGLRLRVFAGRRPAAVLRRLTAQIGRQPAPAAPWMLGAWFHTGQENQPPTEQERGHVGLLRDAGAPVSTVETHLRYLPCGAAEGRREAERERVRWLHSQGLATISYLNPEVCQAYARVWDDGAARGVFLRRPSGEPYVFDAYVGDRTPPQTPVSMIDFSASGAQEFWDGIAAQLVEDGHDGWMEDFGEYVPLDSVAANGMDGTEMHNLYPVLYHRAGQRFVDAQRRPVVRHVRSGWTGVHPWAQIVWGGDPTTDWGYDGLRSAVYNGLTMGTSGIGIWGSDVGGFFSLGTRRLSDELLQRWVQFGAVSGVMRTKAAGVAIPAYARPQVWDADQIDNWRRYAELRTQLYPYIAAAAASYRRSGMPIMRHLALTYPRDSRAVAQDEEFLFGPDLLAAPVLEPGASERSVYLPRGRWVDLWRSVAYRPRRGGAFSLRDLVLERGRRQVSVPAPLDELPLLVRAGAVLPLLPAGVDTLARYGERSLVKLRERDDQLHLIAFPRGRSKSRYYDSGKIVSRESARGWTVELRGHPIRRLELEAALGTLRRPFAPCGVSADGAGLAPAAWSFRRNSKTLRVRPPAGTRSIAVLRRCG